MSSHNRYYIISRFPTDSIPREIGFRPIGDEKIPGEYLNFRLNVERVTRTINAIYEDEEGKRLEMFEQVYQATCVCFSGNESDFPSASQALNEIKKTILTSSWSKIRNRIMTVYGMFSLIGIFILGIMQFIFINKLYNLPIVLIGTCLGSWLSISLKTGSITFDEIYENISQHRSLFLRLTYSCVLSLVASLCLLAGLIEIKVGNSSTEMIPNHVSIALSFGIFFGLGESSLASKLSKKVKETLA